MGEAAVSMYVTLESPGGCPTCGITFAMPSNLLRVKREEGGNFYCPNGHVQSYTKTEVTRLKEQLAQKEQELLNKQKSLEWERKRVENAERVAAAAKGEVTKIKNRVGNGVCPCCKRTFQNLLRHMKSKHPKYKDAAASE